MRQRNSPAVPSEQALPKAVKVGSGSKAAQAARLRHVCSNSINRHQSPRAAGPFRAKTGLMHCSKKERAQLFDHLVGTREQRGRYIEAECLRGFEIDDEVNPGDLLNRKIGRRFTLE